MADKENKEYILPIRALTVKEMRALRKAGLDPAFAKGEDENTVFFAAVDWILEHVYGSAVTDDMPYSEAFRLAADTYAMTYGREKAIKN